MEETPRSVRILFFSFFFIVLPSFFSFLSFHFYLFFFWRESEAYLGGADAVVVLVDLEDVEHLLAGLAAVHEALGHGARREDLVALAELLERHAVREPLAADPDPLKHTWGGPVT